MKYKDFFNIFTEAPINNLELVGNWEKDKRSSGWDPSSRKMLANPSYINKLKSSWNKSEIDFDVYLFKTPEVSKFKNLYYEKSFTTPEFVQNEMKLNIPINPQNITMIFTNNIGDEKVNLIEDTLSVYDNDLNIAVDNALNRCIGKIIVM